MRDRIRDAARGIFIEEGIEGISMRRVAAVVGVTPTAIYRHFTDKDAMITALVDEGFDLFDTKLRRASKGRAGLEAVRLQLYAYIDFAIAHPRYYDAMFIVRRKDVRRFPEDFQPGGAPTFRLVMDGVVRANEDGDLQPGDPLETTLIVWAQVHGLAALFRSGRFGDQPRRFRETSRRAIRRMLDGLAA
jgi:AcrR family transcriptional regulator